MTSTKARYGDAIQASPPPAEYKYEMYDSVGAVNTEHWNSASCHTTSLFMNLGFIAAVEQSMSSHAAFRHVILYDEQSRPVGCASFCIYRVDLTTLAGRVIKALAGGIRRVFPSFGYVTMLFCGLPVSIGQNSVALIRECDPGRAVETLDGIMGKLAKQEGIRFSVFKEFSAEECNMMDRLLPHGYWRFETPRMHFFPPRFRSFERYTDALKSHYRYDIKRSKRKLAESGFTITRLRDGEQIAKVYTSELHRLYENVVSKAENKLEVLPKDFFREVAKRFSGAVSLTLISSDDRTLAFNYSLSAGDSYWFLFCGIDYRFNRQADLYFNLMYQDLENGFHEGVSSVQVGQASEHFKARLGCESVPLFFYIKTDGVLRMLIRWGSFILFPPRPPVVRFDVFKAQRRP
ncbi:MAG TPA: GNAT family N-acetyltransferase [Blastocatellia bacterium]|nr:GNAT family N-acetyltransferase [Blastocatellia bacterium]